MSNGESSKPDDAGLILPTAKKMKGLIKDTGFTQL
jgi:hypothetical protein